MSNTFPIHERYRIHEFRHWISDVFTLKCPEGLSYQIHGQIVDQLLCFRLCGTERIIHRNGIGICAVDQLAIHTIYLDLCPDTGDRDIVCVDPWPAYPLIEGIQRCWRKLIGNDVQHPVIADPGISAGNHSDIAYDLPEAIRTFRKRRNDEAAVQKRAGSEHDAGRIADIHKELHGRDTSSKRQARAEGLICLVHVICCRYDHSLPIALRGHNSVVTVIDRIFQSGIQSVDYIEMDDGAKEIVITVPVIIIGKLQLHSLFNRKTKRDGRFSRPVSDGIIIKGKIVAGEVQAPAVSKGNLRMLSKIRSCLDLFEESTAHVYQIGFTPTMLNDRLSYRSSPSFQDPIFMEPLPV